MKKNILLSLTFFLIIISSFAEKLENTNKTTTTDNKDKTKIVAAKKVLKKKNLTGTSPQEQADFWAQVDKDQKKLNKKTKYEYTICRITIWPGATAYPAAKVYGVNLGLPGSCNITKNQFSTRMRNDIYGIDIAMFFTSASFEGLQVAPVIIDAYEATGMQVSVGGYTEKLTGFQLGFYNGVKYFSGIQLGIINSSYKANGLQIGLINVIEDSIVPLCPFFNFSWF